MLIHKIKTQKAIWIIFLPILKEKIVLEPGNNILGTNIGYKQFFLIRAQISLFHKYISINTYNVYVSEKEHYTLGIKLYETILP